MGKEVKGKREIYAERNEVTETEKEREIEIKKK
jgi:hypothetical protein